MNAPTSTLDFIKQVGDMVTAGGWSVTFEYPGYLCHDQRMVEAELVINIGPDTSDVAGTWVGQYERDGVSVGSWDVPGDTDPAIVAGRILLALNNANVEE